MSGVVWAVIRREYLQRVQSRWFILATVAAPLLMIGLMAASVWLGSPREGDRQIAVVDPTGRMLERVEAGLERAGYTVETASAGADGSEATLRARVEAGELAGLLILDQRTIDEGAALLVTEDEPSLIRRMALQQVITQAALGARLGGDPASVRLLDGGNLEVEMLSGRGERAQDAAFAAAYIGSFLLYITIIVYSVSVMRSVLEEKTTRVVEVVISSMRPFQLMLGKILGVGAVGLTQLAIWSAMVFLAALGGLPMLLAARPELGDLAEIQQYLPGVGYLVLFLVFFVGGYFMFSGAYAAVGAMCNTDEEAQQAQFPVVMFLVIPVIFVTRVIQEPDTALATALSLFPPFTPVLMFARAAAGGAPLWQIALGIAGMAVGVIAVAWLAGRIYKVGILMAGKRPTLPEIVRWVREA